jgi:sugar phosphate isomerase/epimerase/predicted phosphodiesterase
MPVRFIQITDIHLSDRRDTTTYHALSWAIQEATRQAPDFIVVSGDMTTYGTKASERLILEAFQNVSVPVFYTLGNAEHRSSVSIFPQTQTQHHTQNGILFLFPNTSRGHISADERSNLQAHASTSHQTAIITHYPIDALNKDSAQWLTGFLSQNNIELYVAGHKHIHHTRQTGSCLAFITRGIDPDKASGHLPGISLFERSDNGEWAETFIPWSYDITLMPSNIAPLPSPVGWSIQGDPILAVQETRSTDLNVLEIRPNKLTFSVTALKAEILGLRNNRPLYLSWHLPNLSWNNETNCIDGIAEMVNHVAIAQEIGVNHLTVHVPHISAHQMTDDVWIQFEETYDTLFRNAVSSGIRLAIENVHNNPGIKPTDPSCKFATNIDNYVKWIHVLQNRFADISNSQVGAHFDVGHARNNGEYGNIYPLSDWYARVGKYILGYHIHQIRNHPNTGKLENHKEMFSLFEQRISYAGFLHAWSTKQINRAPLFVEIRNDNERRRSTQRLHQLFLRASEIKTSTDLPLSFSA